MKRFIFGVCLVLSWTVGAQVLLKENIISKKTKPVETTQPACGRSFPIKVATFPSNPPFGWSKRVRDKNGKPAYISEGYGFDVFQALANDLNYQMTSVGFTNYEQALNALITGDVDVLAGVYYNPAMLSSSLNIMMPAYFLNPVTIYFRADNPISARKLEDLVPYKGIIRQEEALYPVLFEQLPKNLDLTPISGSEAAFEAILTGKADYLLGSMYALESEKNRLKLDNLIDHNSHILVNYGLFFAFSPVSQCRKLQPEFSEKLRAFNESEKATSMMAQADNLWRSYFPNATFLKEMGIKETETILELPLTPMILDLETQEETSQSLPVPPILSDEAANDLGVQENAPEQPDKELKSITLEPSNDVPQEQPTEDPKNIATNALNDLGMPLVKEQTPPSTESPKKTNDLNINTLQEIIEMPLVKEEEKQLGIPGLPLVKEQEQPVSLEDVKEQNPLDLTDNTLDELGAKEETTPPAATEETTLSEETETQVVPQQSPELPLTNLKPVAKTENQPIPNPIEEKQVDFQELSPEDVPANLNF